MRTPIARYLAAHAHIREGILDSPSQRRRKLRNRPFANIEAGRLVHDGYPPTLTLPACGRVRWALTARLSVVLLVGDVLEPGDMLAVEMLLHCNVHHVGVRPRAVPVLFLRRK